MVGASHALDPLTDCPIPGDLDQTKPSSSSPSLFAVLCIVEGLLSLPLQKRNFAIFWRDINPRKKEEDWADKKCFIGRKSIGLFMCAWCFGF